MGGQKPEKTKNVYASVFLPMYEPTDGNNPSKLCKNVILLHRKVSFIKL